MHHQVGGRGGDVEAMRISTIGRSGHRLWRGWLRVVGHGRVCYTPLFGKGVAACRRSVERGSDAATAGGIGADEGQGKAAQKHPSNHPTSQQRHINLF